MNKILHVFWKSNPDLLPEYVDTLKVFYKRIRSFRGEDTPHILFDHLGPLLRSLHQERPDISWIVVHPVGSYFLDQDALVYHYQKFIDALGAGRFAGGFLKSDKTLDPGKSFFLHVPTALQFLENSSLPDTASPADLSSLFQSAHLPIAELPPRFLLSACYPDLGQETPAFNKALESFFSAQIPKTYQQRQFLAFLYLKKLHLDREGPLPSPFSYDPRKSHVFFFNTEILIPNEEWIQNHRRPLDMFVGTCAGFLDICNLHYFGYHPDTELIYYDLNPDSILFKKYMWENFDGNWDNLIPTIEDFCRANPEVEGFDQDIYPHKTEDLKALFKNDKDLFAQTWKDLQGMQKKFIGTDLIFEFDQLLAQIPREKTIFFSVSDVFLAHNELMWGLKTVTHQFQKLVAACSAYPNMILQGKDTEDTIFIDFAKNLPLRFWTPNDETRI